MIVAGLLEPEGTALVVKNSNARLRLQDTEFGCRDPRHQQRVTERGDLRGWNRNEDFIVVAARKHGQ